MIWTKLSSMIGMISHLNGWISGGQGWCVLDKVFVCSVFIIVQATLVQRLTLLSNKCIIACLCQFQLFLRRCSRYITVSHRTSRTSRIVLA
jgi:hypothetical protein